MILPDKRINLVLGGGGIKGLAYVGTFSVLEEHGFSVNNIAGVSAGALAGAYLGAGYTAAELARIMETFDFGEIDLTRIDQAVPIVREYMNFLNQSRYAGSGGVRYFLCQNADLRCEDDSDPEMSDIRGNILKSLVVFSKEGSLLDGDYLEEWVYNTLLEKGIEKFGDLRGGVVDGQNPNGYRVRMTAVDATRNKILVLPDDVVFYGLKPDEFSVAKAVRMSTSIPFAFKPVTITCYEGKRKKTYNIVDGGIFDNFPHWLIDGSQYPRTFGFRLGGGKKKKFLSWNTPVAAYKKLISSIQDLGIPKTKLVLKNVAVIDTSRVSFMDFNISEKEKRYLVAAGRKATLELLNKINRKQKKVLI